ncbi:hypothetical protein F4777DRAFT_139850 [Nemania sp. FL0916]|nr:hypothetical protein F4777DRAFT_139850 [Nemania sp. FL0916]
MVDQMNVTGQPDIDNTLWTEHGCFPVINIHNTTCSLSLSNVTYVNASLLLKSSVFIDLDDSSPFDHIRSDRILPSTRRISFISNIEIGLNFSAMPSIHGNISFIGNINRSLDLSLLASVTNLVITDHLGNSDFISSKLVLQQRRSIINCFNCNGSTDSPPTFIPSPTSNSSHGLSEGAKAGIGVSVGFLVIGSILAAIWIFLYYRKQQQQQRTNATALSSTFKERREVHPPDLSGLYEARTSYVVREAPDNAVQEMPVDRAEKPDDHIIREMEQPAAEMPGREPAMGESRIR